MGFFDKVDEHERTAAVRDQGVEFHDCCFVEPSSRNQAIVRRHRCLR